ncbi:MAG: ParB/RepB/Spo0J family partition protein, partial [Chloroflexi bacterium]|nr:ParB/RepB/Spo0J family partition protein [Chloroflexota bacterium]
VEEIPIERIRHNPRQPRKGISDAFSERSLQELAKSINLHGVLQPILVKPSGRFYQIVAGERRYKACQLLELATIPARVVEPSTDEEEMEIALVENLQRRDLDPLEEAEIYRRMVQEQGYTYRSLADKVGKSLGYIDTRLKLLSHMDVTDAVQHLNLGVGDARELAKIKDADVRQKLISRLADGTLSRPAFREAVRKALGKPARSLVEERESARTPENLHDRLMRALDEILRYLEEIRDPDAFKNQYPETVARLEGLVARTRGIVTVVPEQTTTVQPELVSPPEPESEAHHAPKAKVTEEAAKKQAVNFVRDFRDSTGITIRDKIAMYWTALERRGHNFQLGTWWAENPQESEWKVYLGFKIDGQEYDAEWFYDQIEGTVVPSNDPASVLAGW